MDVSRRQFAMTLGSTGSLSFLWETAAAQVEQTGEVSAEIVSALLDLQGSRGIYEDPARFEELRKAVARTIRVRQSLRSFEVPEDLQPSIVFHRG